MAKQLFLVSSPFTEPGKPYIIQDGSISKLCDAGEEYLL